MQNELSREAFAELVVRELKRQGVKEKSVDDAHAGGLLSLNAKWDAKRTYNALLFYQPRASPKGIEELAIALERRAGLEESKDDLASYSSEEWLRVNQQFIEGVCSITMSSPSAQSARLASALFIDCVSFCLFSSSGSISWLECDALTITSHLSSSMLSGYRPKDIGTWCDRLADIVTEFERQNKNESWKKYLNTLRESIVVEAATCANSHSDMDRFKCVLTAFLRCAPSSGSLVFEFWDTFSGLAKDLKRTPQALGMVSERALDLLPSVSEALNSSSNDLRAPDAASALGVIDVLICTNDQLALKAVQGAGVIRYATVAYSSRRFGSHDLFLSQFLQRLAWKSEKACDYMLALDEFRARALAASDPPTSTPSERAIWALALASCASSQAPGRDLASTIAVERLRALDARNGSALLRYLTDSAVISKVRTWTHSREVLECVERIRPTKQAQVEGESSTDVIDDDFAILHSAYKKALAGLRGGSGGVD